MSTRLNLIYLYGGRQQEFKDGNSMGFINLISVSDCGTRSFFVLCSSLPRTLRRIMLFIAEKERVFPLAATISFPVISPNVSIRPGWTQKIRKNKLARESVNPRSFITRFDPFFFSRIIPGDGRWGLGVVVPLVTPVGPAGATYDSVLLFFFFTTPGRPQSFAACVAIYQSERVLSTATAQQLHLSSAIAAGLLLVLRIESSTT